MVYWAANGEARPPSRVESQEAIAGSPPQQHQQSPAVEPRGYSGMPGLSVLVSRPHDGRSSQQQQWGCGTHPSGPGNLLATPQASLENGYHLLFQSGCAKCGFWVTMGLYKFVLFFSKPLGINQTQVKITKFQVHVSGKTRCAETFSTSANVVSGFHPIMQKGNCCAVIFGSRSTSKSDA